MNQNNPLDTKQDADSHDDLNSNEQNTSFQDDLNSNEQNTNFQENTSSTEQGTDFQDDTSSKDYSEPHSNEYQEYEGSSEAIFTILEQHTEKTTVATRLYDTFSTLGFPFLLILVALLSLQYFILPRPLWFFSESLYADIYMTMQQSKEYLVLMLNGQPYADLPPLYFLYLMLVGLIPGLSMPELIFVSNAITCVSFIGMTWIFTRVIGYDKYIAFGTSLICLSSLYLYSLNLTVGFGVFSGLNIFFATLCLMAFTCFYRAWIAKSAPLCLTFAFILSTAAILTKGPFVIFFFLLPSVLFIIWQGNPGRINQKDVIFGFTLMFAILLGWILFLLFDGRLDYVKNILHSQFNIQFNSLWWQNIVLLLILLLPWIFAIFFVSWAKSIRTYSEIGNDKQKLSAGVWLCSIGLTGLVIACLTQDSVYIAAIFVPAVIMLSRAILNLSPSRSRIFFAIPALTAFFLGILLIILQFNSFFGSFLPLENLSPLLQTILQTVSTNPFFTLIFISISFLVFSAILFQFTQKSSPRGALFVTCVGLILCTLPINYLVLPKIDNLLSVEEQISFLNSQYPQGYALATYQVDADLYAFYYKNKIDEYTDTPVIQFNDAMSMQDYIANTQNAVLILPQSTLDFLDIKNEVQILDTFLVRDTQVALIKQRPSIHTLDAIESMPIPNIRANDADKNRGGLQPRPSPLIENNTTPTTKLPEYPEPISPEENPTQAPSPHDDLLTKPQAEEIIPRKIPTYPNMPTEDGLEYRIMEPIEL